MISTQDVITALTAEKRNIANMLDPSKIRMANSINSQVYASAIHTNPEDFLVDVTYKITSGTSRYEIPTDFMSVDVRKSGIYRTTSGTEYALLDFTSGTGTPVVGETVTGADSSSAGTILEIYSSYFILYDIDGEFEDGEALSMTGGWAGTFSDIEYFSRTDSMLGMTNYGSSREGYYIEKSKIYRTGIAKDEINILRYIPRLTLFTTGSSASDYYVNIPYSDGDYLDLLTEMAIVFYEHFNNNKYDMQFAQSASYQIAQDFFSKVNKSPRVFTI